MHAHWLAVVGGSGGGEWPAWAVTLFVLFWAAGAIYVVTTKIRNRRR